MRGLHFIIMNIVDLRLSSYPNATTHAVQFYCIINFKLKYLWLSRYNGFRANNCIFDIEMLYYALFSFSKFK